MSSVQFTPDQVTFGSKSTLGPFKRTLQYTNPSDYMMLRTMLNIRDMDAFEEWLNRKPDLNRPDSLGNTILFDAAFIDKSGTFVKKLLEAGCNPNVSNKQGKTPLYIAVKENSLNVVKTLLSHGATLHAGRTNPLTEALTRPKLLAYLIEANSPIKLADRSQFASAFVSSILYDHLDASEQLLKAGVSPNWPSFTGNQAIYLVSSLEHIDFLATDGANLNAQSYDKMETPLARHVVSGNRTLINALLKYDIDVNVPDSHGVTPLMQAVSKGLLDIVASLRKHGAALDHQDNAGNSVLMYATMSDNGPLFESLLTAGLDIAHTNNKGEDVLDWAFQNDADNIASILIKRLPNTPQLNQRINAAYANALTTGQDGLLMCLPSFLDETSPLEDMI